MTALDKPFDSERRRTCTRANLSLERLYSPTQAEDPSDQPLLLGLLCAWRWLLAGLVNGSTTYLSSSAHHDAFTSAILQGVA